ncbi:MAG: YeeE/YedE family protein [bacterium]|nr:YeeE/YedE family protein [bacterium]
MEQKKYSSPYIAGVGLGLVLLASFFIAGRGLGASGALMRTVVAAEKTISTEHVNNNTYLAKYGGEEKNPFDNWLVFEVIGVLVGGMLSGALAGRLKKETNKGPNISNKQRWAFALLGGSLFGFGARLARGCTSGVALSGGATLALGSWVTMIAIFVGAYAAAYFVRRLWI